MRKIEVDGSDCRFVVKSKTNVANSIRRALMSDVETYAPKSVLVRENTSCQTDEYIAHRIGLIPFLKVSDLAESTIAVSDRQVMSTDVVGNGFKAAVNMPIIKLGREQRLDATVHFSKGTGAMHAKFSHIAAVSYMVDKDTTHMSFQTFDGVDPLVYLSQAIDSLIRRVDAALHFVETRYDDCKSIGP